MEQTLEGNANLKPDDIPPICYENLINLNTITTAIVSPKSDSGRRFWTAINMKNHGFNKNQMHGYQYLEGKNFPY